MQYFEKAIHHFRGAPRITFRSATWNLMRSLIKQKSWWILFCCFISLPTRAGVIFLNSDRSGSDSYIIDNGAVPLGQKIPVILIHGVNLDGVPANTLLDGWSNFIQYFNSDTELSSKFKYYQFAYKSNVEPIEQLASNLAELLKRLSSDSNFEAKPIVIVAHSMGGLITRALLEQVQAGTQRKWSERVIRVITLGTPHHGTPSANDSGLFGSLGCALGSFYILTAPFDAFKSITSSWPSPYQVNRSELRWDNYNGLPCWSAGNSDQHSWVSDLNARSSPSSDQKLIVYAGFMTQTPGHAGDYQAGEPIIATAIGAASDGVVPLQSALFDTRNVATTRIFSDYDHSQMWQGKSGDASLFGKIRDDLIAAAKLAEPPRTTITTILPRTLNAMPIGQTQLITIIGSGFTASTRLNFRRGTTEFSDRVPVFISTGELRYDISVGADAASWTVKVINSGVESLPYEFYVVKSGSELAALSISGPATINKGGVALFSAKAYFTDGTSQAVNANWTVTGGGASINPSSGQLVAEIANANTTVRVNASYNSGGVTKASSTDVTIVSGGGGFQTQQLIVNGSFASGSAGWTLQGAFQADSRFETCRSCPGYAYLSTVVGAAGNNLSGTLSQTFNIPISAVEVALDYFHRTTTTEAGGNIDRLNVYLQLSNGSLVGLDDIWNSNANTSYDQRSIDLTAYKGQTVTLVFGGTTSATLPTTFRIDDVSVIATVPNPKVLASIGVRGPTAVPEGTTAKYDAIGIYSDGSISEITPTWKVNSNTSSISSSGDLNVGSVDHDTAVTVTATFGGYVLDYNLTIFNVATEFSYLSINGPNVVNDSSSGQFTANAIYSNGTSQSVSPNWSVTSGPGNISNTGRFSVGDISNDATTTVFASYTINGVTLNASQPVTVIDVSKPVTLVSFSIIGPNSLNENSIAQYTASASFSDGSSQAVNAQWNEDSPIISISNFGLLGAGVVVSDASVAFTASYINEGITYKASKTVLIVNVSVTPIYTISINASNGAVSKAPNQDRYDSGSQVILTAMPSNGYQFSFWSGDATGNQNPLTVTMAANKSITANFTPISNSVISSVDGTSGWLNTGGTTKTIAFTVSGSNTLLVVGWGHDNDGKVTSITFDGVPLSSLGFQPFTTYQGYHYNTGMFYLLNPHPGTHDLVFTRDMSVATMDYTVGLYAGVLQSGQPEGFKIGATTSPTMTPGATIVTKKPGSWIIGASYNDYYISNAGSNTFIRELSPDKSALFDSNGGVDLGSHDLSWSLIGIGNGSWVFGEFAAANHPDLLRYTLSVNASNGTVTKNPDQANYASGSQVNLTAMPSNGYQFGFWSGDATGNQNPLPVTMAANKSITANFTPISNSGISFVDGTSGWLNTGGTTKTIAFTVSGSNTLLVVGWGHDNDGKVTSITFDGVPLSSLGLQAFTTYQGYHYNTGMFYLLNPNPGTHDLVFTRDMSVATMDYTVGLYAGVLQSGQPEGLKIGATTSPTMTPGTTIVTKKRGSWIIGTSYNDYYISNAGSNTFIRELSPDKSALFDSNGGVDLGSHDLSWSLIGIGNGSWVFGEFAAANSSQLRRFSETALTADGFQFKLSGDPGSQVSLETSDDFVKWSPLSVTTMPDTGFVRLSYPALGRRFYRVASVSGSAATP